MHLKVLHQGNLATSSKALLLLHGRGSTAQDILGLTDFFSDSHLFVVAPQAPNNTWYPFSFMEEEEMNEPYLSNSIKSIKNLIDETSQHIPKEQIYLMGFSQGACLILEIAARFATKYGGVIAFTGGLIGKTLQEKKYQGNFSGTKVFISNGDQDPHIPLKRSEESKKIMEKLDAQVTLKIYPGRDHTILPDEIQFVKKAFFGR